MGLSRTLTTLGIGAVAGYFAAQPAYPGIHERAPSPLHRAGGLRIVVVGREPAPAAAPPGAADSALPPANGRTASERGEAHVRSVA